MKLATRLAVMLATPFLLVAVILLYPVLVYCVKSDAIRETIELP